jgi:hypothetical protein
MYTCIQLQNGICCFPARTHAHTHILTCALVADGKLGEVLALGEQLGIRALGAPSCLAVTHVVRALRSRAASHNSARLLGRQVLAALGREVSLVAVLGQQAHVDWLQVAATVPIVIKGISVIIK